MLRAAARRPARHGQRRRVPARSRTAYRPGHRLGNALLTGMVRWVFGTGVSDMLSGYRVFSRRFVKSFPALAAGFETETEFTVHALALHMPMRRDPDRPTAAAPAGSRVQAEHLADGMRILRTIVTLIQRERPLQVFSLPAIVLFGRRWRSAAGGGRVPRHRPGAAPADRGAVDRAGAAGGPVAGLRADPGYRLARPQGDEAAGLPVVASPTIYDDCTRPDRALDRRRRSTRRLAPVRCGHHHPGARPGRGDTGRDRLGAGRRPACHASVRAGPGVQAPRRWHGFAAAVAGQRDARCVVRTQPGRGGGRNLVCRAGHAG